MLQCPWSAAAIAEVIGQYDRALPEGAWPNWVLGNHDQPRIASRIGKLQARVAAMLLFTLPGTLTMYYGEEIGMTNVPIAPEQVQDPAEKNEPGIGQGRDPERTPMCWDQSPFAGFTTGVPWLPLGEDRSSVNVAVGAAGQLHRSCMIYQQTHRPAKEPSDPDQRQIACNSSEENILRFRRSGAEEIEVILNMTHESIAVHPPRAVVLAGTHNDREGQSLTGLTTLRAAEGLLLLVA